MTEIKIGTGSLVGSVVFACGLLLLFAGSAGAYSEYAAHGDPPAGCDDCHGGFRTSPYVSLSDGEDWGDDLHDVHRRGMLNFDCQTCHNASGNSPVFIGSSQGGTGLDPIACSGCHGRAQDGTGTGSEGYGAGLRQHHWVANADVNGISTRVCITCHLDDTDPADYTPVGEEVLPPYYSDTDTAHPDIPSDSCNPAVDLYPENYAGTTLGLDNDGDFLYDELDAFPCPEPGETLMLGVGIGFLLLAGRWRAGRR